MQPKSKGETLRSPSCLVFMMDPLLYCGGSECARAVRAWSAGADRPLTLWHGPGRHSDEVR